MISTQPLFLVGLKIRYGLQKEGDQVDSHKLFNTLGNGLFFLSLLAACSQLSIQSPHLLTITYAVGRYQTLLLLR